MVQKRSIFTGHRRTSRVLLWSSPHTRLRPHRARRCRGREPGGLRSAPDSACRSIASVIRPEYLTRHPYPVLVPVSPHLLKYAEPSQSGRAPVLLGQGVDERSISSASDKYTPMGALLSQGSNGFGLPKMSVPRARTRTHGHRHTAPRHSQSIATTWSSLLPPRCRCRPTPRCVGQAQGRRSNPE